MKSPAPVAAVSPKLRKETGCRLQRIGMRFLVHYEHMVLPGMENFTVALALEFGSPLC